MKILIDKKEYITIMQFDNVTLDFYIINRNFCH